MAGKTLKTGTVAACAVLTLALCAGPALGKSKAPSRGVGTAVLSGAGTAGTAVARCPKRTYAAGGGYGQSPPATGAGNTLVDISGSYRLNKKSWAVTGTQIGGGDSKLTAIVYCRKSKKIKAALSSQSVAAAGRSQATATAACPKGRAISGGFRKPDFSLNGNSFTFLTDNEQDRSNSWTVTAVRATSAAPSAGLVTSYVYCAKRKVKEVTGSGAGVVPSPPTKPSLRTIVSSRVCKPSPFAGGFRAPYVDVNPTDQGRVAFLVTDSRATGKTWTVAGLPIGGGDTVGQRINVSALGYCG